MLSNLWYIFNTIHISVIIVIKLLAHRKRQIVSCIRFRIYNDDGFYTEIMITNTNLILLIRVILVRVYYWRHIPT